ncbi:phosphoglycerate dehydrogenase [Singulisphaera acidiphila]|uniref:Lactate dehydrogenase-like oxidoreductase n=1 Tax=Singulisphaera acidiphila (strain ATCC BAA-1392 / DSM 18658 / VKM B-2454 / MOB10) TaxID=886293 RepID=L0DG79_SINAD|nr:phosphoglycerate dehydrogenase [Singulisphaera acidiphila]AGA27818.1 lactate dehydrogenase-like oxidoreductase [Singulisphaera acidiphila DSM 18658]
MPTVLITPAPLRDRPGSYREIFEAAGFQCVDFRGEQVPTEASLRAILPEVDAIVAGGEQITATVLDAAPRLRVIARTGVGYDAVDVVAATARKVAVVITPGTNQESVAEQAFALLLALTRSIVKNDQIIHQGGWDRTLVQPLRGKTLGLVGLGRIGRAMATRALAFGMRVLAYDPVADLDFDTRHGIVRGPFEDLLAASDVVSLHIPLTPDTQGLINAQTLARMRPGSYLINTSRGGLVVEADLAASLASGHLAGAGLDVLNAEPPKPDNPLLSAPNVVLSPHMGGIDVKSMADMAELAAKCIVSLHQGIWPTDCVVNGELAKDWRW